MTRTSHKMNRHVIAFAIATAAISLLYSCKKSKTDPQPVSPNYARLLNESENLTIPDAVALPFGTNGNTRIATLYAEGVQKYKAQIKPNSQPAIYEWILAGPEADLYDWTNKKIGTHGAGPHWQLFGGTDSIFGQHFAPPKSAPSTEPSTIDWLLLMPKAGKTSTGLFANVDYIQRIATVGGKAPVTPPSSLNDTVDVKYTAIYRFSKKNQ